MNGTWSAPLWSRWQSSALSWSRGHLVRVGAGDDGVGDGVLGLVARVERQVARAEQRGLSRADLSLEDQPSAHAGANRVEQIWYCLAMLASVGQRKPCHWPLISMSRCRTRLRGNLRVRHPGAQASARTVGEALSGGQHDLARNVLGGLGHEGLPRVRERVDRADLRAQLALVDEAGNGAELGTARVPYEMNDADVV